LGYAEILRRVNLLCFFGQRLKQTKQYYTINEVILKTFIMRQLSY